MKLFADTASPHEIDYCFERGINNGITTNPKIMENAAVRNFDLACQDLLVRYSNVPVSLETDLRGIPVSEIEERVEEVKNVLLLQADKISALGRNAVVKIPICTGGLLATKELTARGIKTNVTGCMNPYQALNAASMGATYVSLFANRMLDSRILELAGHDLEKLANPDFNWKSVLKENTESFKEEAWGIVLADIAYVAHDLERNGKTELIVGSIRFPEDLNKIALAQPQIITVPYKIARDLENIPGLKRPRGREINAFHNEITRSITHPMTSLTLEEFERAADSYRKN